MVFSLRNEMHKNEMLYLTLITLLAYSANDKLVIFF